MSAKVQGWVWDLEDLLPQRRLVLLWLATRATDSGVCFPGQAEVRRKTGLGEKMVRRHLRWQASDADDDGKPKAPLISIVERRIDADRNTSNVYVLHVPWAVRDDVAHELEELKHVPAAAMIPLVPRSAVATSSSGRGMKMSLGNSSMRRRCPERTRWSSVAPPACWSRRCTAA